MMAATVAEAARLDRTTVSALLKARLELLLPAAGDVTSQIVARIASDDLYPPLLSLAHTIVRASVPLLRAAEAEAARLAAAGDTVARELVGYFQHHAVEELHHDEWLLEDYRALGRDPADLLADVPSPTVAAMVGAAYYWSLHHHPVALLGYIAVLEGTPPTSELIDAVQTLSGYPADAFRTLRHHGDIDPAHRADLWNLLDSLPLTPNHVEVILTTALNTLDLHTTAHDELLTGPTKPKTPQPRAVRERLQSIFRARAAMLWPSQSHETQSQETAAEG